MSNPASEGCSLLVAAGLVSLLLAGCIMFERYEAPYSGATLGDSQSILFYDPTVPMSNVYLVPNTTTNGPKWVPMPEK